MSYSCPLCHAPLSRSDNHYSCPQRHQFDLAKEGYVNLLPVQFKRSRDPGDSAEMILDMLEVTECHCKSKRII